MLAAFATPAIIGGRRLKVASTLAYDEFLNTLNWPLGAVVAVMLLVALAAIIIGANRLVDNSHAGGIIAAVDMKSGTLGPATDIGLRPGIGWRTHHPDTGAVIEGRVLPFWPETVALACRAHAAFAPRVPVRAGSRRD